MIKKVCVYAICKNELRFVNDWLDNMSEADYIVVLDTGSTDGTFEALQNDKRVTKVEQKVISPWRFDVARNESMKLIPEDANILVCTDFDELFKPGWCKIVKENWKEDTTRALYLYAWGLTENKQPADFLTYAKIHTKDYFWKYPVHELLEPNKGLVEKTVKLPDSVFLQHYRDTSKPRSYYFDLLKLSRSENPKDAHVQMLLAREYSLCDKTNDAIREYKKALQMAEKDKEGKLLVLECLNQLANYCIEKKQYNEAIDYCNRFIQIDHTYRVPYFFLGQIYIQLGIYTLAEACFDAGFEYCQRKFNLVERQAAWYGWGEFNLSWAKFHLGKFDDAILLINIALSYEPNNPDYLKHLEVYTKGKELFMQGKNPAEAYQLLVESR